MDVEVPGGLEMRNQEWRTETNLKVLEVRGRGKRRVVLGEMREQGKHVFCFSEKEVLSDTTVQLLSCGCLSLSA